MFTFNSAAVPQPMQISVYRSILCKLLVHVHQHTQTHIYSAKQAASKRLKSATSRKRRQNQNVEIDELASLVPLAQTSLVPSDKLSVLRLATTFLKLQSFMKESELTLNELFCRMIPSLKLYIYVHCNSSKSILLVCASSEGVNDAF